MSKKFSELVKTLNEDRDKKIEDVFGVLSSKKLSRKEKYLKLVTLTNDSALKYDCEVIKNDEIDSQKETFFIKSLLINIIGENMPAIYSLLNQENLKKKESAKLATDITADYSNKINESLGKLKSLSCK